MAVSHTICLDCERKHVNGVCKVLTPEGQADYKREGFCPFKYLEGGTSGHNRGESAHQDVR